MKRVVRLSEKDNTAVVLLDLKGGEALTEISSDLIAVQEIPYGHKIALCDMKKGDTVLKYGEVVGRCTKDIAKGSWVHVHNVESIRGLGR